MIHAKVALMTLMRGTDSAIGDIDAEMILWTNTARPEDGELFDQPMARYFVRIAKSEGCPACGEDLEETAEECSLPGSENTACPPGRRTLKISLSAL